MVEIMLRSWSEAIKEKQKACPIFTINKFHTHICYALSLSLMCVCECMHICVCEYVMLLLTCFSYKLMVFKHFFFPSFFLPLNSFVHSHVTLMVCFKANFLLRTIKYCLIFSTFYTQAYTHTQWHTHTHTEDQHIACTHAHMHWKQPHSTCLQQVGLVGIKATQTHTHTRKWCTHTCPHKWCTHTCTHKWCAHTQCTVETSTQYLPAAGRSCPNQSRSDPHRPGREQSLCWVPPGCWNPHLGKGKVI